VAAQFPAGFVFPFYEGQYTSVRVSSEGFLYFSGPMSSGDGASSEEKLAANRIIAPLWMNLRTNGTGNDIFVGTDTAGQVTIRWNATNETDNSQVNFAVTLFDRRRDPLRLWPGNTNLSPIVGISRGDGRFYVLAEHSGQVSLTDATSVSFTLSRETYADIGAFEFRRQRRSDTAPRDRHHARSDPRRSEDGRRGG
jgi:hypothetical protein